MAALVELVEIDHRINFGPIHLLKIEKSIDTSHGSWEKVVGQRDDPLSYTGTIKTVLRIRDASLPVVELEVFDGAVDLGVKRTIDGSAINADPETKGRLRLK